MCQNLQIKKKESPLHYQPPATNCPQNSAQCSRPNPPQKHFCTQRPSTCVNIYPRNYYLTRLLSDRGRLSLTCAVGRSRILYLFFANLKIITFSWRGFHAVLPSSPRVAVVTARGFKSQQKPQPATSFERHDGRNEKRKEVTQSSCPLPSRGAYLRGNHTTQPAHEFLIFVWSLHDNNAGMVTGTT